MSSILNLNDLRVLSGELLAHWKVHEQPEELTQPKARREQAITSTDIARMQSVIGLTRHVHENASAVRLLLENEHSQGSIPIVRFAYECALTAVWLVQSEEDEGIRAFAHEYVRGNKSLQDNLRRAVSTTFRENADLIADVDLSRFVPSLDNARRFDLICEDLTPGGKDAYIYYRILSSFSHASINVVDLYFELDPAGGPVPALRDKAREPISAEFLLYLTCASMVWSARAVTYLTGNKPYRNFLRKVAQQLGVTSEIQLSQSYFQRHAAAKKFTRENEN